MNIEAELVNALRTLIPWAGPRINASAERLRAIRVAEDAIRKAELLSIAKLAQEDVGLRLTQ